MAGRIVELRTYAHEDFAFFRMAHSPEDPDIKYKLYYDEAGFSATFSLVLVAYIESLDIELEYGNVDADGWTTVRWVNLRKGT
jgi:hypothetical protein